MSNKDYPHFRRGQQRKLRGYSTPQRRGAQKMAFVPLVAVLSAVVFVGVGFGDRLPAAVLSVVTFSRNLERDHAPPPGAYYSGCDEARAAGVAPLYDGEPGYRPGMDGDSDGIACEPYRG